MHRAVSLPMKIEALRSLETYGYQIAYYILQDEGLAIEATKLALLALGKEDPFFHHSPTVQREIMKKTAMRQSIAVKQKSLPAGESVSSIS